MKDLIRIALKSSMLVVIVAAGGCSRINPAAPRWEVELNFPLLDNNICLADLMGGWAKAQCDFNSADVVMPVRLTGLVRSIELPRFDGSISSGKIEYQLENTLPLSIDSAAIYLGPDSSELYQDPMVMIGPLNAGASAVDSNGNSVPTINKLSIILTPSQLEALTSSGSRFYGGYSLIVKVEPGSLPPADSLAHVRNQAVATIVRRIN